MTEGRSFCRASGFVTFMALVCSVPAHTAEGGTVRDEGLRLRVLRAVFPGAAISRLPSQPADHGLPNAERPPGDDKADVFAGGPKYSVRGPALNEAEDCASEDVVTGNRSLNRELRLQVLRVDGGSARSFAAVLQYE